MAGFDLVARLKLDDQFSSPMSKAMRQMEKTESVTKRMSTGVKNFGRQVTGIASAIGVTAAISKGFNMVRDSVGSAFARIDTMEKFEQTMTVLTGSSEKTAAALEATREAVTGTAYGLDVAAKGVQDFVTRGMDISKATDTMAAWGDAVSFYGNGSNEQLASVSDALAKMYSSGKVSMDQVNRLYDAGIDAPGMYAQAVGREVSAVQKDLSSGAISADEFITTVSTAMMEGTNGVVKIAGAAKENGATWGATFDNMRAAVTRGVVSIIQQIDKMLTDSGLSDMRTMVAEFGGHFESALNKVSEKIPEIVSKIKEIYEQIKPWFPTIREGLIGIAVGFATFKVAMTGMSIISKVNALMAAFRAGTVLATLAQWGLNTALLANPLTWIVVAIAAVVAAGVLLYRNWDTVKEKAVELWAKVTEVFGAIKDWIVEKIGQAKDFVVWYFTEMPKIAAEKLGHMLGVTVTWLSQLPGKFKEFFSNAYDNAVNIVKELPGKIAGFISEIPGKVAGVISTVYSKFKELGAAIPRAIADGFNAAVGAIGKAARWAIDKVVGGMSNLRDLGGQVASSFGSGYTAGRGVPTRHYHGIDYVSKNNSPAILHKGEAVLTAQENKARQQGGKGDVYFGDIHLHGVGGDMHKAADQLMDIMARKIKAAGDMGA